MKLLNKSSLIFVIVSIVIFLITSIIFYTLITFTINNENDEKLKVNNLRVFHLVSKNDVVHDLPPIYEITELNEAPSLSMESYKDTLIYDEIENDIELFREYKKSYKLGEKTFQITTRQIKLETHDYFNSIGLSILISFLLLIIIILILNRIIFKNIWFDFYYNLSQLKKISFSSIEDVNLKDSNIKEFKDLKDISESMLNKLKQEYLSLKEFTENASHEIQTPLAIIQNNIEELLQDTTIDEQKIRSIQSIYFNINRLKKINKNLLLISKIENQQFRDVEPININHILNQILIDLNDLIHQKDIQLKCVFKDELIIKGSKTLIEILITNLLTNAIKHNNLNGFINIEINKNSLTIENSGIDLSNDQKKQIFKRFYKSSSNSSSVGLGLNIVDSICKSNNYKLEYFNENGKHKFIIHF